MSRIACIFRATDREQRKRCPGNAEVNKLYLINETKHEGYCIYHCPAGLSGNSPQMVKDCLPTKKKQTYNPLILLKTITGTKLEICNQRYKIKQKPVLCKKVVKLSYETGRFKLFDILIALNRFCYYNILHVVGFPMISLKSPCMILPVCLFNCSLPIKTARAWLAQVHYNSTGIMLQYLSVRAGHINCFTVPISRRYP